MKTKDTAAEPWAKARLKGGHAYMCRPFVHNMPHPSTDRTQLETTLEVDVMQNLHATCRASASRFDFRTAASLSIVNHRIPGK